MKAWLVSTKDEFGSVIVFAETRGQARAMALSLDGFEDDKFTDIEVRRSPYADKYFKEGKRYLDWDNPIDRIVLVKYLGFVCDCDYLEWEDCEGCFAKDYCDRYKDHIADLKQEDNR